MIGKKFRCNRDFSAVQIKSGEVGYVYNTYRWGIELIFENGGYSAFSFEEVKIFLREIDAPEDTFAHQSYKFQNVMQLARDYEEGYWSF